MVDDVIPGSYAILNSLLVLTYSAFCLTSLDTATRLARFMFQEFWLEPGQTTKDVKEGWKKVMVNPYFATILTVVLGILLIVLAVVLVIEGVQTLKNQKAKKAA